MGIKPLTIIKINTDSLVSSEAVPELSQWLSGKDSPANAGDMGSIPGLGFLHAAKQFSPCATSMDPGL